MKTKRIPALLATIGMALLVASPLAAQLKSPDDVKTALRLLVQVSNDFKGIAEEFRAPAAREYGIPRSRRRPARRR